MSERQRGWLRNTARAAVAVVVLAPGVVAGGSVLAALDDARFGDQPVVRASRPLARSDATPLLSLRRFATAWSTVLSEAQAHQRVAEVATGLAGGSCLTVLRNGAPWVDQQGAQALVPASNAKVLLALALLRAIEPATTFRTTVATTGALGADGVLTGDLYLIGSGDPMLSTPEYLARYSAGRGEPRTQVEALADRVVAAGVKVVTGAVIGDESRYDTVRSVPSWPSRYVANRESGPLSALSIDDGFVYDAATDVYVPAPDPAAGAAGVLTELLRARGVEMRGAPRSGRAPAPPDGPAPAELAAVDSAPLRDIVGELLRESDNTNAELLLKELGKRVGGEGSTVAGARAVVDTVRALGIPAEGLNVVDGSGLDPTNTVSCTTLVGALQAAGPDSDLANGLSLAGETGTLRRRFDGTAADGKLRGKSGSINSVVTLSGFVDGPLGRFTFAFLVNAPDAADTAYPRWLQLADSLVAAPAGPDPAALGPAP